MADQDLTPAGFGTTFKAFMDAVVAAAEPPGSPLLTRLRTHLGGDASQLPVVAEEFEPYDHPNVQVALDDLLANGNRERALLGLGLDNRRFMSIGLADLLSWSGIPGRGGLAEGPVEYVNFHLADNRVLPCVQFGLYLVADGDARLAVFVGGPSPNMGPHQKHRVEVTAARRGDAEAFLASLVERMGQLNVYRGHVISLGASMTGMGPQTMASFHSLPNVAREDVVLPAGVLERIERQTIVFSQQADRLLAAGRSLKRGVLLYGPPGVGKTLTTMYLIGQMPGRTVILTTGQGFRMVGSVAQIARRLAPAMVVLEDVDMIAGERAQPFGGGPLLFELLNEMDGLREDCDIIFLLTTNRADLLEPALAARPGRIDLAIEFPLPDADGRLRLLQLYARGLELRDVDLGAIVEQSDGVSPAFIKELLRKAALLAMGDGESTVVSGRHLAEAMAELNEGDRLAQRLLGFRPNQDPAGGMTSMGPPPQLRSTGFPARAVWIQQGGG